MVMRRQNLGQHLDNGGTPGSPVGPLLAGVGVWLTFQEPPEVVVLRGFWLSEPPAGLSPAPAADVIGSSWVKSPAARVRATGLDGRRVLRLVELDRATAGEPEARLPAPRLR